jgi:4-carboxymuconolactone decarboxylase
VRLHAFTPDELDEAQRRVYAGLTGGGRLAPRAPEPGQAPSPVRMVDDDGRLLGPFNAFLVHPALGELLQELSRRLRFDGVLGVRAREVAILTVAGHERSDFEWAAHHRIGREAGLGEAALASFARGELPGDGELDDPLDAAVARLAHALVTTGDADDATWAAVQPVLGDAGVFEVSTTVSFYGLLAQQLRLFRVPSPEPGPWERSR